jgi:hypothetical protein
MHAHRVQTTTPSAWHLQVLQPSVAGKLAPTS